MQIPELRAGVIGTGFIGPVHIEALRRLGVQVTALSDLPERAAAVGGRLGIAEVHDDYRALVRSPNVDVVHIASPNRFHGEMSLAALHAGKHVVCEKPLAMNTRETARIVRSARASPRIFAVNYNVRFYPAVLQLRRLVQRGDLGDILHAQGSYLQDWLFKDTDYNWRLLPQEGGRLRAVADIGTHWMDTAAFILGASVQAVFADLGIHHRTRQRPLGEVETFSRTKAALSYAPYRVKTEDYAHLLLRFSNGTRASLAVSQVAAGRKNCIRLELYGSKKSAWWCSEEPDVLHFGNRDGANESAMRGTPAFGPDVAPYADYPAGHVEGFPDTFKMLFRSVYGFIAAGGNGKGERLFATAQDGHHEVAICEAILRSQQTRAWVQV
ncbi:MAG: Gfo/Idh/MocA family oxidoreductase [Verrucomicrobia bacterium]|nr:Gfo/Idh/MocA family oxidoreductase [Verrucomicrobiota bacterium]